MSAEPRLGPLADFFDLPLWVTWRAIPRRRGGKLTKIPFTPGTERQAKSNDPKTWRTYAEAAANQRERDGIGLELADIGDGRHFGGVDLDSCIDADGKLADWAREIVEILDSYTEISPSGRGLKIFFVYRTTALQGMTWRYHEVKHEAAEGEKAPGIEFYVGNIYFTVTGKCFEAFDAVRMVSADRLQHVQDAMARFALSAEQLRRVQETMERLTPKKQPGVGGRARR